jgi:hypothetical protein
MKKILLFSLLFLVGNSYGQVVFEHVSKTAIYDYLDEMSNLKLIELNSAIKPYSRTFIAEKLKEIDQKKETLNKRQKGELEFFLRDYRKELNLPNQIDWLGKKVFGKNSVKFSEREKRVDLFFYKDSLFNISVNPVGGATVWANDSGMVYHRWNGAEMNAYVGKHLGIYGNLRDNYVSQNIYDPTFLTHDMGGRFKTATIGFSNRKAREYSEMRGGLTYAWKWGHLGLIKEHNVWGNNYNGSNILTSRSPSYAQIKLNIKPAKWIELNYFHGWLASQVVDSSRTQNYGTGFNEVYVPKYLAMNMFTIKPIKYLHFSFGNSIVYSNNINAGYLIPFIFFKSLDHTYSSVGNSSLFFDLSIRNLKKVHIYFSGFIDELSIGRMFKKDLHSNFWSGKAGIRLSNLVRNVTLTAEYTVTNPITYKHYNPETTYESTGYNLGHYLRDNAQDMYFQIVYKPLPRLSLAFDYNYASKGPDYEDNRNLINPTTGKVFVWGLPFQESLIWESTTLGFQANYQILNDIHVKLGARYSNVWDPTGKYTPTVFSGKQLTTTATVCWGF